MTESHQKFVISTQELAFDLDRRKRMSQKQESFLEALSQSKLQFERLELARQRAAKTKKNILDDLEKYLKDFEGNFQKNGGEIIWASSAKEAIKEIANLVQKHGIKKAVKSKSSVAQEIDLSLHLQKMGVLTTETNVGDFFLDKEGEKPYHMVESSMHKSLEEKAKAFSNSDILSKEDPSQEMADEIRKKLSQTFYEADLGITGADFLIVNQGAIAISESEGSSVLSASVPKIHLAIAGIESLIPDINDLELFWSLLSTYSVGQRTASQNIIVKGPRHHQEHDGPDKMYLLLIDNGRSNVLNTEHQREALSCIKCGTCSNVCPVFQTIGGQVFDTPYSGPIASVIMPLMKGMAEYDHLSHACTLCGKCSQECPVDIPIDQLILYNRRDAVLANQSNPYLVKLIKSYKRATKSRWMMEVMGTGIKQIVLNSKVKSQWGVKREMPKLANKSFQKQWKELNK